MDRNELEGVIEQAFRGNKQYLKSVIIDFMNQQCDSMLNFGFIGLLREDFDMSKTFQIINTSFNLEENPQFSLKDGIFFKLLSERDLYPFSIEVSKDAIDRSKVVVNTYLDSFRIEDSFFQIASDFNCYEEQIVEKSKKMPPSLYNGEGWNLFLKQILDYLYPDFIRIEKKKIVSFSKNLTDSIKLHIEYSIKEFESSLKQGILMLPDVYLYCSLEDNIKIPLGEFKNPFFRLTSLHGYKALIGIDMDDNGVIHSSTEFFKEQRSDDRVRFFGDENKGQLYKRYAFFEQYLQSVYNRLYLNYIENVLLEIENHLI